MTVELVAVKVNFYVSMTFLHTVQYYILLLNTFIPFEGKPH